MYITGPAHKLLICKYGIPTCWSASQPAEIHVSCKKGTDNSYFSLRNTHTKPKNKTKKNASQIFQRLFWCFSASHKMVQSTNKDGHIISLLKSVSLRLNFDSPGFYCSAAKAGNLCWRSDCYTFMSASCTDCTEGGNRKQYQELCSLIILQLFELIVNGKVMSTPVSIKQHNSPLQHQPRGLRIAHSWTCGSQAPFRTERSEPSSNKRCKIW